MIGKWMNTGCARAVRLDSVSLHHTNVVCSDSAHRQMGKTTREDACCCQIRAELGIILITHKLLVGGMRVQHQQTSGMMLSITHPARKTLWQGGCG